MQEINKPIVFFDGYCGICNRFIDFLFRADKNDKLLFTALQGETAKKLFPNGELDQYDSIGYSLNGKVYFKSSAVLRILLTTGRGWQLCSIFFIIPRFVRDPIYDWVARNRYQWFGKKDQCRVATPEEKLKLLP